MTTTGLRALRKVHIGRETTPGTAIAPTLFLVGALTPRLNQQLYRPDNLDTGRLALHERSIITYTQADLRFESDANYEQVAHLLDMAIEGSGGVYMPDYVNFNTYGTYSFYYGDNLINWQATRVQAQQLTFSGQVSDVVKVSARMFGQDMVRVGSTGGPTLLPQVTPGNAMYIDAPGAGDLTPAVVNTGHFYTGASWAGLIARQAAITGATVAGADGHQLRPATLADFNYTINTGLAPLPYVDGELSYTDVAQARRGVEANLTLAISRESGAAIGYAEELYDAHLAQELQFFGLQFTDGTSTLDLQLSGHVTDYGELAEREGQSIVRVQFQSTYEDDRDMRVVLA